MYFKTLFRKQLLKAGYELVKYTIRNNDKLRRMNEHLPKFWIIQ